MEARDFVLFTSKISVQGQCLNQGKSCLPKAYGGTVVIVTGPQLVVREPSE